MKNTLETRLGLFVALILLASFFVLVIVGGIDKFQRGLHMHAYFNSVQELKVGDRVKQAGVEIGKVEQIAADYTHNKVHVILKIRKEIEGVPVVIKSDSLATIKFAGLMGQSFVSLDFGTQAGIPLTDGQDLKTEEQADIGAIMQELHSVAKGVQDVTKAFAGESMNNLFATLSDFMKRNADDLSLSISNMTWASSQIREGKGTIGRLVADDALYTSATNTVMSLQNTISNLQSTADEIKATFAEGRKVIDGMNAGEGSVGKLLKDEKASN